MVFTRCKVDASQRSAPRQVYNSLPALVLHSILCSSLAFVHDMPTHPFLGQMHFGRRCEKEGIEIAKRHIKYSTGGSLYEEGRFGCRIDRILGSKARVSRPFFLSYRIDYDSDSNQIEHEAEDNVDYEGNVFKVDDSDTFNLDPPGDEMMWKRSVNSSDDYSEINAVNSRLDLSVDSTSSAADLRQNHNSGQKKKNKKVSAAAVLQKRSDKHSHPSNYFLQNATAPRSPNPTTSDSQLESNPTAPTTDIAYFYLHKTLNLSEETMWKITLEAGSVLGMTVQNLSHKVSLLRRTMDLSDEDIRTIIGKHPSILHMSANRNIAPTILFLVRALDLGKEELRRMIVRYPAILCYSMNNLREKIDFFVHTVGFDVGDESEAARLRDMLVGEPKLLCAAVETGLLPRFKFLNREVNIPSDDLRSILTRNPRILLYSLQENLQAKIISFLIMRLQMDQSHVLRILKSYPQLLDYNLEEHMLPIARYLMTELTFSPMELRSILLKCPRIITHSLHKIKHVVGYFQYELGMDAVQTKRVLFQAPQVVGLNTDETLVGKVAFLRERFGLEDDELRKVIAGMPTLLLCSIERNLSPKADYLLHEFDDDRSELKGAVLTLPTLLGYSVEKRIKPRMERIRNVGAHARKITVGITMKEEAFESWISSKAAKIERMAGGSVEPTSTRKVGQKDGSVSDTTAKVFVAPLLSKEEATANDVNRRKARIVHWKR